MSLEGRPSRRTRRTVDAEHEARVAEFEGRAPGPVMRYGLSLTGRGGRNVVADTYERAGSRWPVIPLVGLWVLAIVRIVVTIKHPPTEAMAVVWSAAIFVVAVLATWAWMRAGARAGAARPRRHPHGRRR